ncbi:ParE family toxin-like protein [Vibrio neonatus]
MNRQKIIVVDGVTIQVSTPKGQPRVVTMAKSMVSRIRTNDIQRGMRPKVLQKNKNWLSYRINRKYRLLVERTCRNTGPYYCMSRTEFDYWISTL